LHCGPDRPVFFVERGHGAGRTWLMRRHGEAAAKPAGVIRHG
jgi:hypothetical protein